MMPNITRGSRISGLLVYLTGEGRHNEHEDPHLVAGDSAIVTMYGYGQLDKATALRIAADIDEPRVLFGTEVARLQRSADKDTGEVTSQRVAADVWHCSLSLRSEEGQLSDERWGEIAQAFVDRMGFTEEGSGKAACRWVAVRHGLSTNGNDHVHIAVSLVREDGTKAPTHNDFRRAQDVCRDLENEYGLDGLESREQGRGERGEKPAERATAERQGAAEVASRRLERAVRGAATASLDEGEFVRRVKGSGILIRPRYAVGREDVIAGFSVALRTTDNTQPVWYGGGRLARDLTLPRLREGWVDHNVDSAVESAQGAVDEWKAASRNPWSTRTVAPGREVQEVSPELWQEYTAELGKLREQLRQVPVGDRAGWAHVARETAGAFAAWSLRVEPTPGPLADTARQLSKTAHIRAHVSRPKRAGLASTSGAAMLLMQAASTAGGTMAEAMLLRQLGRTAVAVLDMHTAMGEARRAREIHWAMTQRLDEVTKRLPQPGRAAPLTAAGVDAQAAEAVRVAQAGQSTRLTGSPVPTRLDPSRPKTTVTPVRREGPER